MKLKKYAKIISVISAAFLIVAVMTVPLFADSVKELKPNSEFYLNDFADVVSDADGKEIIALGAQLEKLTKAQVVVVTVDTIGDEEIRDVGYTLADNWKVGDEKLDNGILILLAVGDRNYSIEVGYGLEGAIPDITSKRIQDDVMTPYFKDNNFSAGLVAGYRKIAALIYGEYDMEMPESLEGEDVSALVDEPMSALQIVFVVIIVGFIMVVSLIGRRRGRRGFFGGFGGWGHGGGWGPGGTGNGGGGFFGGGGGISGGGGSFGGGGSSSRF